MPTCPPNQDVHAHAWWRRDHHAGRRPALLARTRIKAALRTWFAQQGYIEVETACLQVSPGNETHLHAFRTDMVAVDGTTAPLYLHTSPEFACKKLLAAGEERLFTFAPAFRNRERSALHHPEFTMLEWYEKGADYTHLMEQCGEILAIAANETGNTAWQLRGRSANPTAPIERLGVADAFRRFAGIDLLATLDGTATDRPALAAAAANTGIRISADDTWSDIFTRVLVEKIEPHLGNASPAILDAYPISEAALARPAPADPRTAERFELYCCGVELANGFGELTDAAAQRARFEADMDEKQRIYGERYPIDEEFLAALADMPPASGCALGFDRLVMLATGAQRIDQVIWTPLPDIEATTCLPPETP
jgi:lysyl-tRNA synthetase class 2